MSYTTLAPYTLACVVLSRARTAAGLAPLRQRANAPLRGTRGTQLEGSTSQLTMKLFPREHSTTLLRSSTGPFTIGGRSRVTAGKK